MVLEAALLRLPSICFEGSGGITDFIDKDCGWVIPEFSTNQTVDCINEARSNREVLNMKGELAHKKVIDLHTDRDKVVSEFDNIIQKVIS